MTETPNDPIPTPDEVRARIRGEELAGEEIVTKVAVWLREEAQFDERGNADYKDWPEELMVGHPRTVYVLRRLAGRGWSAKLWNGGRARFAHFVLRVNLPK